jgi:pilus assembly protein CpaB
MKKTLMLRVGLIATIVLVGLFTFGKEAVDYVRTWNSAGGEETVPVLITDRYIPPFQIVKPAFVKVRRFPREYVPVGALQSVNDLQKENGQLLYVTVIGVPANQPLTRMALNEAGRNQGMSSLLMPGKVAVSFPVERSRAAGGWIRPGDTIAIFRSLLPSAGGRGAQLGTPLLLESIQVLAVDHDHVGERSKENEETDAVRVAAQELTQQEADTQILTVLANTREAAALVEARERGPLSVALRSMGDDLPWSVGGVTAR